MFYYYQNQDNAGIYLPNVTQSADGYEMQFATNHLGHFLLTNKLIPLMKPSNECAYPKIILNVSSCAHFASSEINYDSVIQPSSSNYFRNGHYAISKLANVLFTCKLSEILRKGKLRELI